MGIAGIGAHVIMLYGTSGSYDEVRAILVNRKYASTAQGDSLVVDQGCNILGVEIDFITVCVCVCVCVCGLVGVCTRMVCMVEKCFNRFS